MTRGLSRRHFLFSLAATGLSSAAAPAFAEALDRSLRPKARGDKTAAPAPDTPEDLISKARLGDGIVGFAVLSAATGQLLESHRGTLGLPPASVAKSLTASYGLDVLGPDYRFSTELWTTGAIVGGELRGDLVLVGGGDPTLDTDGLAKLARNLEEVGIKSITGRFIVDGGVLPYAPVIDTEQPVHVAYNPAVAGINLNYNRVSFEWERKGEGYEVSMDAPSMAGRQAVRMAHMEVADRNGPIYTYADLNGRDEWSVAKHALGQDGSRWLPVRKPELYAGEVFQALAGSRGLQLPEPVIEHGVETVDFIGRVESEPLHVVLKEMLKYSTNLTAELVGLTATRKRLGHALSIKHSAEEMNAWARDSMGLTHVAMTDHSGLGGDSRVAAADVAMAVLVAERRLKLKPLMKPITVLDNRGRPVKDAKLQVHAKTGTLNFVSGLAGYVDLPSGEGLVFAIFCGDVPRRDAIPIEERERPPGMMEWNTRAKMLQQDLIRRWGAMFPEGKGPETVAVSSVTPAMQTSSGTAALVETVEP
ncbi:D-alanyl-D-alanine carboxypeptidase/D-alanyl-D-alanine-endopeptidase [Salipiger mangrovisoli]|uniref:D-alanyl-D-alanine carboxypeptidase/D-alanyl-D-alanine-endopeptidase n=1 Tax=Salipiger mangrovisoli TaxID=2865933 RepID=A0ABR9WZ80_9RHOB|nr:D-alanyl-D-alanine carboxypeptidase/D-alanyl-D-alanine-endopeptidase [Salipiger mangrovisoli]MBE9636610.1 D-alanyl-D-alanine carboxypeptidase/D-alanyl-D-alanine-endopeptidase [Salipiger mangrovisoli]